MKKKCLILITSGLLIPFLGFAAAPKISCPSIVICHKADDAGSCFTSHDGGIQGLNIRTGISAGPIVAKRYHWDAASVYSTQSDEGAYVYCNYTYQYKNRHGDYATSTISFASRRHYLIAAGNWSKITENISYCANSAGDPSACAVKQG